MVPPFVIPGPRLPLSHSEKLWAEQDKLKMSNDNWQIRGWFYFPLLSPLAARAWMKPIVSLACASVIVLNLVVECRWAEQCFH